MNEICCPFCASAANMKTDKKGRPYFSCQFCGVRVFLNGDVALQGLLMLTGVVSGLGREKWRAELEQALGRPLDLQFTVKSDEKAPAEVPVQQELVSA